jgi:hypothetical protein
MKLERVSSVVYAGTVQPSAGEKSRLPLPGDTVLLVCEATSGEELLATLDGVTVRLAGIDQGSQGLQPGDTVLIRVLRTEPSLQIELEGPPMRASVQAGGFASSFVASQSAMRLDQAALSQVAWHTANAAALAKMWQRLAQARWSGPQAGWSGPAMADPEPLARSSTFGPWGFAVYTQDGRQMTLGLAEALDSSARHRRQRRPLALRLALSAPGLGRLVLEVQWAGGGGIQLSIAVERAESIRAVRSMASAIAVALGRANLRLVRCRLVQGTGSHARLGGAPVDPFGTQSFTEALSPQLFRALAEAAVVLMESAVGPSAVSPGAVNPGSRRY